MRNEKSYQIGLPTFPKMKYGGYQPGQFAFTGPSISSIPGVKSTMGLNRFEYKN